MPVTVAAVYVVVSHMKHPAARIAFVTGQYAGLQAGRYGERLIGGTRFIRVAYAEVVPQCIQLLKLLFIIHSLYGFLGIVSCQVSWVVEVKVRIRCFCDYLSVLRVHDDNCRVLAALSLRSFVLMLFVEFQYMLFNDALHLEVYGRYDGAPVHRLFYRALHAGFLVKISIFPAVGPIQDRIV